MLFWIDYLPIWGPLGPYFGDPFSATQKNWLASIGSDSDFFSNRGYLLPLNRPWKFDLANSGADAGIYHRYWLSRLGD